MIILEEDIFKNIHKKYSGINQLYFCLEKNRRTLYYSNAVGNCKHCYLDNINVVYLDKDFEKINHILKDKLTFTINSTKLDLLKKWEKKFKLIEYTKIPTGYFDKYQIHATFLTNNTKYPNYKEYKEKIKPKKFPKFIKLINV